MRLWHKDLIDVLPKEQLVSQWRELCSLYARENRHVLINFVWDDYDIRHLGAYSRLVLNEFKKRKYRTLDASKSKLYSFFRVHDMNYHEISMYYEDIYSNKMNDAYLRQCLYNLEEKAMCGGITKEEWQKIYNKFKSKFDLWGGSNE